MVGSIFLSDVPSAGEKRGYLGSEKRIVSEFPGCAAFGQHSLWVRQGFANSSFRGNFQSRERTRQCSYRVEKRLHVSVFQRESTDEYAAQGGTTRPTWRAGERLASPPTWTLPEPFSLCDSERIKVLSLNRMDDLSSHSKVVHRALCRHWNGATVTTSTETIVALI